MDGQTSLYPLVPEKCCVNCGFYSALKEPRERSDGAVIYGYCFKGGDRDYNTNMGKGYPVFIDAGFCKQFKKRRKPDEKTEAARNTGGNRIF